MALGSYQKVGAFIYRIILDSLGFSFFVSFATVHATIACDSTGRYVYAAMASFDGSFIYTSSDYGLTWAHAYIAGNMKSLYWGSDYIVLKAIVSVLCDSSGRKVQALVCIYGYSDAALSSCTGLLSSNDYGTTWTLSTIDNSNTYYIAKDATDTHVYSIIDNGIFKTTPCQASRVFGFLSIGGTTTSSSSNTITATSSSSSNGMCTTKQYPQGGASGSSSLSHVKTTLLKRSNNATTTSTTSSTKLRKK